MAKEAEKANNIYAWGADCYPPLSGDIGPTIFGPRSGRNLWRGFINAELQLAPRVGVDLEPGGIHSPRSNRRYFSAVHACRSRQA